MTLIALIRRFECNAISSLRIKKGLSSGSYGCMAILCWLFQALEPRQDFCVSHPTLSTMTGSGSNCIKLKTPTGQPVSDVCFKWETGKAICITVNLSVPVFSCCIIAGQEQGITFKSSCSDNRSAFPRMKH